MKLLSLICITSILITIYSLKNWTVYEDLAVNKTLNHSGSFGKNFVKFEEKDKNIIHQPKVSTAFGLLSGGTPDHGHSLSQYGPPGWRITYIHICA